MKAGKMLFQKQESGLQGCCRLPQGGVPCTSAHYTNLPEQDTAVLGIRGKHIPATVVQSILL